MAAVVDYDDVVVVVAVAGHDAVAGSPVRAYLHFVAAVAAVSYTHLDVYKRQIFQEQTMSWSRQT